MNLYRWTATAAKISSGIALALLLQPASGIQEMIVHGKRTELEIDRSAFRVDVEIHRQRLAENVRTALERSRREVRVASVAPEPRG